MGQTILFLIAVVFLFLGISLQKTYNGLPIKELRRRSVGGDNYARFLLEEIFPFVENKKTSDGRAIILSRNGNGRAIGGSSSGAVCAFTAAWERPEEFSRVFSAIGTYTGLRGADRYDILIRKNNRTAI